MPVDREQWLETFVELPHWRCTTCGKGQLTPMADKLLIEETGPSLAAHEIDAWEPEWIVARFAGFLQCNYKACHEVASISGDAPINVFEYQDEYEHYQNIAHHYTVKAILPPPLPIVLPEAVPDGIKEVASSAAALIWASSEAAGNQLRQVVELFLNEMGIPAQTASGGYIAAHDRIKQFEKVDAENGEALLAVKWLGNSSSHPGGLSRDDVLDAFDMIEFVLENKYGTTKAALKAKIAAINAAKGPANTNGAP
jgi:Domain of unknown function (DUF4145)